MENHIRISRPGQGKPGHGGFLTLITLDRHFLIYYKSLITHGAEHLKKALGD